MAGQDEIHQEPSVDLRPASPEITVTAITADSVPGEADGARHRARRWRHAISVDGLGWGWPPIRRWPGVAARGVSAWARQPSGRLVLPALLILALIGVTGAAGAYLVPSASPENEPSVAPTEPSVEPTGLLQTPAEPTFLPPVTGGPVLGRPADALAGWAQQMTTRTQIPATAIQAYGYAEYVVSRTTPNCRLTWPTLAAIGKVESNHGQANSATLTSDGRAFPPIYGQPLDGQGGRSLIRDTDGGNLDRDTTYDRAIGPLQFIPSTWMLYQVDADDDGIRDPHDIDDAALAAANYLCAAGRNLSVPASWTQAILSYNNLTPYVDQVYAAANDYGARSRGTP